MVTIKQTEQRVGIVLPGQHTAATAPSAYGWARPMTQGVVLVGFASSDNSTGMSAQERRHR